MRFASAVFLLTLSLNPAAGPQTRPSAGPVDRTHLEEVEDLTESLANQLLELSMETRRRDLDRIGGYFSEKLQASPFPSVPGPLTHEVKWIQAHGWAAGTVPPEPAVGKGVFLKQLDEFLQHFSEVEDARFKVTEARFSDTEAPTGRGRISFYVIGRDSEGRREWVRGSAELTAMKKPEGRWTITDWATGALRSEVSLVDLFSEISRPARIDQSIPKFGVPPNDGFVSHGGAAGDVDRDGLIDLFVTGVGENRLYLNDGSGGFRDVSEETLITFSPVGTGSLLLDFDNDGDLDVFLAAVGKQAMLENRLQPDGALRFIDISDEAGVSASAIGFSATAADINGDSFPDIYVSSYNRYGTVMPNSWSRATNGTANLLFVSQGDGRYREEANRWGVDDGRWSYASVFADVDGDGLQDLFVANDFGEDALYMNKGDRFVEEAEQRGVLDPGNGMGAAFGDFDNDGDLDLHVTNMSSTAGKRILGRLLPGSMPGETILKKLASGNTLYENLGDGRFRDVSERAGYFSAGWAWGGGFLDFDNDGWEDEFTVNGFISGSSMNDT